MSGWTWGERREEGKRRGEEGEQRRGTLPGKRKGSLPRAKNAVAFPGGLRKERERGREGSRSK